MRINRYLALATGLSRRNADGAIGSGRVKVNGEVIALGRIVADNDRVTLDDHPLSLTDKRYVIFNKPAGVVVSRVRQGKSHTIYDLLPEDLYNLKPIGRLDKDSSGLLILTNDGQLAQALGHPSAGKTKIYLVKLDRNLNDPDLARLDEPIQLSDGPSRLKVKRLSNELEVALTEGRNRQIRRSFEALGYKVTKLKRVAFGKLKLRDLKPGEFRELRPEEIL